MVLCCRELSQAQIARKKEHHAVLQGQSDKACQEEATSFVLCCAVLQGCAQDKECQRKQLVLCFTRQRLPEIKMLMLSCRDINRTKIARKKEAIAYFSIESAAALLISLFINLCVVSVFAKGFFGKGAEDIGLKNAGTYLGDRFGQHMVRITCKLCY